MRGKSRDLAHRTSARRAVDRDQFRKSESGLRKPKQGHTSVVVSVAQRPRVEPASPRTGIACRSQTPVPIVSGIGHNGVGAVIPRVSGVCVSSRGLYDVANTPAYADLHTLSDHHRDALHQMRDADEAGPDRAATPEFRSAHLSVHPVRLRRKLFAGAVDRRRIGHSPIARLDRRIANPSGSGVVAPYSPPC
jgi:hypothetical protein